MNPPVCFGKAISWNRGWIWVWGKTSITPDARSRVPEHQCCSCTLLIPASSIRSGQKFSFPEQYFTLRQPDTWTHCRSSSLHQSRQPIAVPSNSNMVPRCFQIWTAKHENQNHYGFGYIRRPYASPLAQCRWKAEDVLRSSAGQAGKRCLSLLRLVFQGYSRKRRKNGLVKSNSWSITHLRLFYVSSLSAKHCDIVRYWVKHYFGYGQDKHRAPFIRSLAAAYFQTPLKDPENLAASDAPDQWQHWKKRYIDCSDKEKVFFFQDPARSVLANGIQVSSGTATATKISKTLRAACTNAPGFLSNAPCQGETPGVQNIL